MQCGGDVRYHFWQARRQQQAAPRQFRQRQAAAVPCRLVQRTCVCQLLYRIRLTSVHRSRRAESTFQCARTCGPGLSFIKVRQPLRHRDAAAQTMRTCKTLSRTSLPAAAGRRPVTRPSPLAADHLPCAEGTVSFVLPNSLPAVHEPGGIPLQTSLYWAWAVAMLWLSVCKAQRARGPCYVQAANTARCGRRHSSWSNFLPGFVCCMPDDCVWVLQRL